MQHEPELMFEALKRRAEESAARGGGVDAGAVATALARAFRSMPYLVVGGDSGGDGMSSDSEVSAGGAEASDDGSYEEWEFIRCLSV
ncbi:putative Arginine decarboxylase [Cocos nucifera]|nr:putative Arginine decarboxylase [Cocos nucifera]